MACTPRIPERITAGLSFSAAFAAAAHPAPDWNLSLHIRGPQAIDLVAEVRGTGHRFAATAEATAAWKPGDYWYSLRASNGADTVEIETGQMHVLPDLLSAPEGYDGRSQAQIALDAIESVLGKRATLDQERYRINNRELYRTPIADLLKLRSFYAQQVRREAARKSGNNRFGRPILVRFS